MAKKYLLELTERQARLLSYVCDQFPRLIQGQGMAYQELFEAAWEKRCKEAVGKGMDDKWEGGWHNMRHDAEDICTLIKRRFWNCGYGAQYGIYYDETADIIWDIHRVIRHQLWQENPDRSQWTVDAENPTSAIGNEPLAKISSKEE